MKPILKELKPLINQMKNNQITDELIKLLDPSIKSKITTAWRSNEEKNTIISIFFDSDLNLNAITSDFNILICPNFKLPLPEDFASIRNATIKSDGSAIVWPGDIPCFSLPELKTKAKDSKLKIKDVLIIERNKIIDSIFFRFLSKSRLNKYDKILDLIDICHYERTKAIANIVIK